MLRNATLLGHDPTKVSFAPLKSNLKGEKSQKTIYLCPSKEMHLEKKMPIKWKSNIRNSS
jgi:hypothetical protein